MTVTTTPTAIQRVIRTAISAGVGFVVAFALTKGLNLVAYEPGIVGALTAAAGTAYNAAANYLEARYSWARFLLGFVGN